MSDVCAERKGTKAGYLRHRKVGEPACDECRAGAAAAERERRHRVGLHKPMKHAKCGTNSGYIRHVKAKERSCRACRRAHKEYMQRWRGGGYADRSNLASCIVDVLTTFQVWMTWEGLAFEVLRLHPEWSEVSVRRVALRLAEEGVIDRRPIRFSSFVEFRADDSAWEKVA